MQKKIVLFGGCGTVGQRTRDAIHVQDDMDVYAIVTRSAKENVLTPYQMGIPIYTVDPQELPKFEKLGIKAKYLETLLQKPESFDLVIDCSPDGQGLKNKQLYYEPLNMKAILEGGEEGAEVEASFNALTNYDEARNKRYVRVVSCNTTGATRVLHALDRFGIVYASGELDRRGNDPHQSGKLPAGAEEVTKHGSHHAEDITTVMPHLHGKIATSAKKSDKQEFHSHTWLITLEEAVTTEDILEALTSTTRIVLLSGKYLFTDTKKIKFWAAERRLRGDLYETLIWPKEYLHITDEQGRKVDKGHYVRLKLLVDQQSITVPENIDAVRAMFNLASQEDSIRKTNYTLGIT